MSEQSVISDRRPLATREYAASKAAAHWLAVLGVSPNTISVAGMIAGIGAGMALAATSFIATPIAIHFCFFAAAILIQLRLLANMFDGMVAIETGKTSPTGALYNEIPDRVSDVAMFVGAGYALGGEPYLGYIAAIMAVFLAYVRAQGRAAGAQQEFCGPMAKPQRAFVMTVLCVVCAITPASWQINLLNADWSIIDGVLVLVIVGEIWTSGRRLLKIARRLRELAL